MSLDDVRSSHDIESTPDTVAGAAVAGQMTQKLPLGGRRRKKAPTSQLPRGATVGRYVVVDLLGAGGMGVVYKAYDPDLDRRIALKVVRASSSRRDRLLREAQALAQLAHPNVVPVYDVGTFGSQLFIAMELVDGHTLDAWLHDQPRTWRQIVDTFVAAGRGLAAAHDAGLIHRDFKPSNVVVGSDARVRVVDIGLARQSDTDASDSGSGDDLHDSGDQWLLRELTQAGSVMGTPSYMSPEQHRGERTDHRSDQFSFCVALWEALYRQRPFAGTTSVELERAIHASKLREPPSDTKVPRRLRHILERGLSVDPADRHPSMQALLAALAHDPWAVRRRWLAVAAAVLVTGAGIAIGATGNDARVDTCTGGADRFAGVWDDGVARAVEARFAAVPGRGPATFDRLRPVLDQYRGSWIALHDSSCRATRDGSQSEELLDLRARCLENRRGDMAALTSVLVDPEREGLVDHAVRAAHAIPSVDDCRDDEALRAAVPLPADPATRTHIAVLEKRLSMATAVEQAGDYAGARVLADTAVAEGRAVDYPPLVGRALYRLSSILRNIGDLEDSKTKLEDAVVVAAHAKDDRLLAQSWVDMVGLVGFDMHRTKDGLGLETAATGALARVGDPPDLEATLLGNLGSIYFSAGEYDRAIELHEKSIELRRARLGENHPEVAISYNNLGNCLWEQGRRDEAMADYRKALDIWEAALGPEHPDLGPALTNMANALTMRGKFAEATELAERSLAIKRAHLGPKNPSLAHSLLNFGELLRRQSRLTEAREAQQQAMAIYREVYGAENVYVAVTLNNIAGTYYAQDRYREAADTFARAHAMLVATVGAEHPYVGYALTGLGKAQIHLGLDREAVANLEAAVALRTSIKSAPADRGESRFALARALGQHSPRARRLAREARADYLAAGEGDEGSLAAVDAFLAGK